MKDLRPREVLSVAPLIALIIFVGVYPKPVLDIINPAVTKTLVQAHSTNPVPPHPAPATASTGSTTSHVRHRARPSQVAQAQAVPKRVHVIQTQRSSA
jgi:NADH-quinone oxidoreductase subunit M